MPEGPYLAGIQAGMTPKQAAELAGYERDKRGLLKIDLPMAVVAIGLMLLFQEVLPWLQERWSPAVQFLAGRILLALLVIILAFGLFFIKQKWQRAYGVLETMFALGSVFHVLHSSASGLQMQHWLGLVGSGYIMVRGMTNYSEARAKARAATESSIGRNPSTQDTAPLG